VNTQRTDFLVGLFILVGVGLVVGMAIVTSGLGERRTTFYLRTDRAEALTPDTRILMRGLDVGRLQEMSPVVDPTSGALVHFVGRIAVTERFANGTELRLPRGTHAEIVQPTPLSAAAIELVLPEEFDGQTFLDPEDTIPAFRPTSLLDAVAEMADELREELQQTLEATRSLMAHTTAAIEDTRTLMATNGPLLSDSVLATLSDTRRTLQRADSVLAIAGTIALENRAYARDIAERLLRTAVVLEHFSDQISRRPARLLTGVTPPPDSLLAPRDTVRAQPDTTRGRP
jgi:ABC-type transporter Mla subunit MlaD